MNEPSEHDEAPAPVAVRPIKQQVSRPSLLDGLPFMRRVLARAMADLVLIGLVLFPAMLVFMLAGLAR